MSAGPRQAKFEATQLPPGALKAMSVGGFSEQGPSRWHGGRSLPGSRPASAGAAIRRPPALGRQATAASALDDELQPPPLAPVPLEFATPLERQFSSVLGLADRMQALKLPAEVEACPRGGRCCWRWLARAAVEQVGGSSTAHLGLAEAVRTLREELTQLRGADSERLDAQAQTSRHSEALLQVQERCAAAEAELRGLRGVQDELGRLQVENDHLRTTNGRLVNTERGLEKVVACLQSQHRVLLEGDLAAARQRAEAAEQRLMESDLQREHLAQRLARTEAELEAEKVKVSMLHRAAEAKAKAKRPGAKRPGTASPGRGRSSNRR